MRRYRAPCLLPSCRLRNWPKSRKNWRKIFLSRARSRRRISRRCYRSQLQRRCGEMSAYRAILLMMALDLCRPFHIARLRIRVLGWSRVLPYFGGLIRTPHEDLERAIRIARSKAALSKRIAFLSRSQQVFRLWHVIHRPFSYSFAVLALIHIVVVIALGFV